MKSKSTPRHYVNNRDLYDALVKYNEKIKESNDLPKIPDYIGICISKICERLSLKPNFSGYTFRDEMVDDGIENCIASIKSFDPSKTENPFAYFTQIAWNAFLRRIAKEKKQTYLKHKNLQHLMLSDVHNTFQIDSNEASDEIIRSFEEKQLTKVNKNVIVTTGIEKFMSGDSE